MFDKDNIDLKKVIGIIWMLLQTPQVTDFKIYV